jgi:acetyl-CoA carboxylase beta subunit
MSTPTRTPEQEVSAWFAETYEKRVSLTWKEVRTALEVHVPGNAEHRLRKLLDAGTLMPVKSRLTPGDRSKLYSREKVMGLILELIQ